jgi:uncharacterized membrane protein
MKTKIANFFEKLRSSYWFLPSVMSILALALAVGLIALDIFKDQYGLINIPWFKLTGASGARAILSTVAASMITVTGIVFSITIVALSLASQQFGPRLLQNFMRDRGNQFVLGTVTSTFLYCLLILGTVSEDPVFPFVPHLSTLVAVVMAVLCVGVLIYFIHHIAESIQVTNVITAVHRDLDTAIKCIFPEKAGESENSREDEYLLAETLPEGFDDLARPVPALCSGFIQAIEVSGLLNLAENRDLLIRLKHRIGHFVVSGEALVEVWPAEAEGIEDLEKTINGFFIFGHKRSQEQDMEFFINELVEIAARALSPGVNDPFTAISCINHLGNALCELAQREFPSALKKDSRNRVRLILYPTTFEQLVGVAFNHIRQYGRSHVGVTIRLLENIEKIILCTRYPEQRQALLSQAAIIERECRVGLSDEADRRDVYERYQGVIQTMEKCFSGICRT